MAKMHVLENITSNNGHSYDVVIHFDVPGTTNDAGVLWSECLVNSGRAVTQLAEGVGAGQISTAEKADVEAGTRAEVRVSILADNVSTLAELEAQGDVEIAKAQADLSKRYKQYGRTQGA